MATDSTKNWVRVINLHTDVISNSPIEGYNCDFGPQGSGSAAKDLPRHIAEELVNAWPNYLFISGEGGSVEYADPRAEVLPEYKWLANVTGDPDEPEFLTVALNTNKDGTVTSSKEKNMRRDPKIVIEYIGGGHVQWESKDGSKMLNQRTLPKQKYVIYPMQRVRLPVAVADAILFKDAKNMPWISGSVIESRPEQPGEPKMSWSIDELRHLGLLMLGEIRGKASFPETEKQVRERLESTGLIEGDPEYTQGLMSVKAAYNNKLMKRYLNAKVKVPTREEFAAYMKRVEEREARAKAVAAKNAK